MGMGRPGNQGAGTVELLQKLSAPEGTARYGLRKSGRRCETLSGTRGAAEDRRSANVKDSARYVKRAEWSDEDQCFVGSCPGVISPCSHGTDEVAVYRLCEIVDEWLKVICAEDGTLPVWTVGRWPETSPDGNSV